MTEASTMSSPGVRFPPPFLFAGGFALGWAIQRWVTPLAIPGAHSTVLTAVGLLLAVVGLALMFSGMLTFRIARTAIIPNRPATRVVENGPYRFTRNPMYTGMTLVYTGGSLLVGSVWPLVFLPAVLVLLVRTVIHREEAYLTSAFGADYLAYQSRVRRWL